MHYRLRDRAINTNQGQEHGAAPLPIAAPVEQPGILFLTHADTDLLLLARVQPRLPKFEGQPFPPFRAFTLRHLRTPGDVDAFLARELPAADVVVLRLHGGRGSFPQGFDRLVELCRAQDKFLICLSGTDALDPELTAASTVSVNARALSVEPFTIASE